jgi:hypothetical protein
VAVGCGADAVEPTGGVELTDGRCGRGLVVVQSDYQSTNVSIVDLEGRVRSSSFLSSASAAPGLSLPLSGDVVAPTAVVAGADAVLIDRHPAAVLTYVDLATAAVRAQLDVSTGFAANPQDYLAVASDKAYVSRYDSNPAPGREPFDAGGDVLVVDPRGPAVVARVDLSAAVDEDGLLPRPWRMARRGHRLYVAALALSADFATSGDSRIVVIDTDTDAVLGVTVLDGLRGCGGLAIEGEGERRLVASCSGGFDGDAVPELGQSAVVVLSTDGELPVELARFVAADHGGRPFGFGVDWADDRLVLASSFGAYAPGGAGVVALDALVAVDVEGGGHEVLLQSEERPFELGEVRCATPIQGGDAGACGRCFVADGERRVLHVLHGDGRAEVVVAPEVGLPPRTLGRL